MRRVLVAGLTAGLIAPAGALAQEVQPPAADGPPVAGDAIPPGPGEARAPPDLTPDGPQPGDPAPPPPPPPPAPASRDKAKPAEKPKLDEAAGGLAGSVLANVAGTAVGGPVGGIAASMVGGRLGSGAVRVGKKMLGVGQKKPAESPVQQAAAAPQAGRDAAAQEPAPPAAEPPAPSGPVLVEEPPATRTDAPT
jgi:hypothetical protein